MLETLLQVFSIIKLLANRRDTHRITNLILLPTEGRKPQIVSAKFGENDEIIVTWESGNNDLTKNEILAQHENGSNKEPVSTEWYKRKGQINDLDSSATYYVTVIEYTMCNQSFSSNTTRVNPSPVMGYTMCNTSFSSNTTWVSPSPVIECTMCNKSFSSNTTGK